MIKAKQILIIAFFIFISSFSSGESQKPDYNLDPEKHLYDKAGILNDKDEAAISSILLTHNKKGLGTIFVITIQKLPAGTSIEKYANELINAFPLVENDKKDRILLLIAFKDRRLRIETSKDVLGFLTDKECSIIIREIIVPAFRDRLYFEGIKAGLSAMISELEE